jgi:hypothetical protein
VSLVAVLSGRILLHPEKTTDNTGIITAKRNILMTLFSSNILFTGKINYRFYQYYAIKKPDS